MSNYFCELNTINVNDKIEKKNGLSYLSWAYAWGEIKKRHPDATYTVYETAGGCFYHTDGHTCWVKTGVKVNGIEHIEYLPVMDYKNKSIPLDSVTSFDVNKAIQRSLTKAVARHGLGLYIYAGEDLPEDEKPESKFKSNVYGDEGRELQEKDNLIREIMKICNNQKALENGAKQSFNKIFSDLNKQELKQVLEHLKGQSHGTMGRDQNGNASA